MKTSPEIPPLAPTDVPPGPSSDVLPAAQSAEVAAGGYLLLVEDNPGDARLTQLLLQEDATEDWSAVRWVQTAGAAMQVLAREPGCAVVLLDLGLPDSEGLQALEALKAYAGGCAIVVMTGLGDDALGLAAVAAGAQDFLVKGSTDARLLRRSLRFAAHRQRQEQALIERSMHDELTGLPRRGLLQDRLHEALKQHQRFGGHGALLYIDLDRFKAVNDSHGHQAGDAVLIAVAQRLKASLRGSDTPARLGGDEFAVLLPQLQAADDALLVGHKLLAVLAQPVPWADTCLSIGASIGVVGFDGQSADAIDALMHRADQAMYAAKGAGRGQVQRLLLAHRPAL